LRRNLVVDEAANDIASGIVLGQQKQTGWCCWVSWAHVSLVRHLSFFRVRFGIVGTEIFFVIH
jgi:hypothetical protein